MSGRGKTVWLFTLHLLFFGGYHDTPGPYWERRLHGTLFIQLLPLLLIESEKGFVFSHITHKASQEELCFK